VDRARDNECRTRVSDFGLHTYELVIVDGELAGIDGKEFVRLLQNAREWRAIHLVALTNRISAPLATELAAWGAFPARKEAWLDDLSHFLITFALKTGGLTVRLFRLVNKHHEPAKPL
jgi:CheY-like chemotaxis protein